MMKNILYYEKNDVLLIGAKEGEREKNDVSQREKHLLSLRVELKTSRLLNGCSNQLSYESFSMTNLSINY